MKTIELVGRVDEQHRLSAEVPNDVAPGQVKVTLVLPDDAAVDLSDQEWSDGIACEWQEDLADPRQDIYTLADGEPVK
jgi:hypothetical protein